MKALFATYPMAFHTPGGGEVQLLAYRDHLQRMGVDVTLFDPWNPRFQDHDVVHFFSCVGGSVHFCNFVRNLGKPLVISLIYTSCYHICPTTTRHLAEVIERAQSVLGEDSFAVITVGFDAARDTPQAMKDFASEQKVAAVHWDFLSSDAQTIAAFSRDLGFQFRPTGGGFDHLLQTTILDADGVVRRQVYGMDYDTPILIEPIKRLIFGEKLSEGFFERMTNKFRLFCTVYDPAADRYRFNYSILVGLAMGAAMGIFFIFLLVREWRYSRRARSETN